MSEANIAIVHDLSASSPPPTRVQGEGWRIIVEHSKSYEHAC